LAIPIIQPKLPTPGTLNNGRIMGSNKTPKKCTTPNEINNSAVIKNGSREGNTISHHILSPRILASKAWLGKMIKLTPIQTTVVAKKNVLYSFCIYGLLDYIILYILFDWA